MKIKIDWNIVFWIGVTIIFLYFMAKEFGLIHSPVYIEMLPYLGAFITLLALAKKFGVFETQLLMIVNELSSMKEDISNIKRELHSVDKRLLILEHKSTS